MAALIPTDTCSYTDNRSDIVSSHDCLNLSNHWPQALQTAQTLDPLKLPNRVTSLLPSTRHSILRNKRCAENASTWLRNVHTPFMGRVIGESTNADTPQEGHYRPDNGSGYRCITNVHTYSYHKSRSPIQCLALMRSAIMLKLILCELLHVLPVWTSSSYHFVWSPIPGPVFKLNFSGRGVVHQASPNLSRSGSLG